MYLSVQQAARRLGVSPVTIRRWTATGFLPCTRTAGGHRRIDEHDIDDLAKAIGGSNHLAAQLAREREVDVLINTATALSVKLDLTELLLEIAMRMTSLLDCHFCAISEYDPDSDATRTLAEYDHAGQRLPDASPYRLRDFPLTRRVLDEQLTAVVNVDDPHADPAEVAELRREGDRSLLMVPLDRPGTQPRPARGRRPEALAAVLASGAPPRRGHRRPGGRRHPERQALRRAPAQRRGRRQPPPGAGQPDRRTSRSSAQGSRRTDVLGHGRRAVCDALGAISCVASMGGESAGAFGAGQVVAAGARRRARHQRQPRGRARPFGRTDLTLAVTLPHSPGEGQVELLDFIAAITAAVAVR